MAMVICHCWFLSERQVILFCIMLKLENRLEEFQIGLQFEIT